MSVYNAHNKAELESAVESVLLQKDVDLEFVIYDDGSDDSGREIIDSVTGWDRKENRSARDERIKLLRGDIRRGIAYGLNRCIEASEGKYLARMDADDVSNPMRLKVMSSWLDEHNEVFFVGCAAELFDEKGKWGVRRLEEYPGLEAYLRFSPYIHPTVMFRSELLRRFQYDESITASECEDYDLFLRLYQEGYLGCNLRQVLYRYREDHKSYSRRTLKRRIREMQVRYRYFKGYDISFAKKTRAILRPIAGVLIPNEIIRLLKHRESRNVGV